MAPGQLCLAPDWPGATQWRKRPVFKFADLVTERYKLMERFEDAFTSRSGDTAPLEPRVEEPSSQGKTLLFTESPAPEPTAAAGTPKSTAPQRNRVAPDGRIFASPERGLFMGNRTSPPRWLICDLHFKRDLKEPRKYTKLFFLDESVALAAGHRPCNTCRREQYRSYLAAAGSDLAINGAGDLDSMLNTPRTAARRRLPIASLPDGAFVQLGDDDFRLKWTGALHRWTPGCYVDPTTPASLSIQEVSVLTPEPSLAALRNGYSAVIHPSAR